ncbi:MAG: DNA topoisomerase 4 subunit A [Brevinematales bacterium]|nr:DNA topoisomerase 4 subunit A [Brevinematales bacterium]
MSKELFDRTEIIESYFEDEIKVSYLNYAYSVITGRAIPDVKDGLKPVQRRILYSMAEMSLWHNKPTKKSARIIGDVLGKYHPHGDSSVYIAMVKMAQEFHMRYPLIIGQGNFGSIDDDPPAAMRYTEAKLSKVAEYILEDLDKETVDFKPNYDDTLNEPVVLPGKFPNLLCNGTTGIAVGLATDIPPHNFKEVARGISAYIDNPNITVRELMKFVPGPDFPTSGIITNKDEIAQIYETGSGTIELAGKIEFEEKSNHNLLVIKEIPYRVIKSKLVEEITNIYLDNNNKYALVLRGIKEIRDESSKEGIRIVLELFKDANVEAIKTALFAQTSLKTRIKVNMTTLVNNHPKLLSLKDIIANYVNHRENVIIRRTNFELDRAKKRIHIVEGLLIAIDNLDEVIKIIRNNETQRAKELLMQKFKLTDIQAEAILEMKLRNLTKLETQKLKEEKIELEKKIADYTDILNNPQRRKDIIKNELLEMEKEIGDDRLTKFEDMDTSKIDTEDLIENLPMLLSISRKGFLIREVGANLVKVGNRGGKGKRGDATDSNKLEKDDYIFETISGYLKDKYLFVTNSGRIYSLKGYEIKGDTEGKITRSHIKNIERLREIEERGERITAVLAVSEFNDDHFIFFITKKGKGTRIPLSQFENINKTGINSIKLIGDDEVVGAIVTDGTKKLFVVKRNSKGFKFSENLFTPHNRNVSGEKATYVGSKDEEVIGMDIADEDKYVLFVTKDGRGKKIPISEFSELVNRGGKGYKLAELGKNRQVACFTKCNDDDIVVITTKNGRRVSFSLKDVQSNLLKLIDLSNGDEVSAVTTLQTDEE